MPQELQATGEPVSRGRAWHSPKQRRHRKVMRMVNSCPPFHPGFQGTTTTNMAAMFRVPLSDIQEHLQTIKRRAPADLELVVGDGLDVQPNSVAPAIERLSSNLCLQQMGG